ncbi:8-oxo-dGTP diphosphatase [Actinoplanes octamycinicus]|uniref:8-oxo-dGTP diphosphatase n=1 Tax=Actinoplanes octamycinicus TaxID=135948 RepID=A0A7W7H8W0_9ACTN|nr:NUDIX domain-containing protein [Actinoplanes octamycinicus]MBB4745732.1 8-oxo-dGTP diphosphatase [Actinoplanes octamycinicus]GIE56580.1 NUDIX hydrolase [Actinoplanes octamycinicus]
MTDEASFLAEYDPRDYPAVAVTVDVVALTIRDGKLCVLLVERGEQPFAGHRALPGGFVRDEPLDEAALRELAEETGLHPGEGPLERVHLEQLRTYGDPGRDPRMRVVSVAYLAFAPHLPEPTAGSDAARAFWIPVEDAKDLAFDHDQILAEGLDRARDKLEYTPLATAFVDREFTVSELRAVYTAVWGEELHAGNFHRKVLSVPGFVESTGETAARGGERGGPRAKLYRAGDATLLHPALLRPTREDRIR